MAATVEDAVKVGFGSVAVLMGALMIAAIAALAAVSGEVSWWVAAPLALAAFLALRRRSPNKIEAPGVNAASISPGDRLKGVNSILEVRGDGIAITREGPVGFLAYGVKGEKLLPFRSITSVQFKAPGPRMAGYIQFGIKGGIEARRGIIEASGDENTVLFAKEQHEQFLGLYHLIEDRISRVPAAIQPSAAMADQLLTLSRLHEEGHLNPAEYSAAKQKILSA